MMDFETQLVKVKRQGGEGIIILSSNETFEVKKLNHSTAGFITFETLCGKYIRHSGDWTFYSKSRRHFN